jgi:hypothetical protein
MNYSHGPVAGKLFIDFNQLFDRTTTIGEDTDGDGQHECQRQRDTHGSSAQSRLAPRALHSAPPGRSSTPSRFVHGDTKHTHILALGEASHVPLRAEANDT